MKWIHSVTDQADLRRQYHKLAKEHHPDRRGGRASDMAEINAEAKAWADRLGHQQACQQRGISYPRSASSQAADDLEAQSLFVNLGPANPIRGSYTLNIDDEIADALARHLCNLVDSGPKMFITTLFWLALVAVLALLFISVVASGHLFTIGM